MSRSPVVSLLLLALAVASPASAEEPLSKLRMCTASEGNNYHQAGSLLREALEGKVDVEVVVTEGSWANLKGMSELPRSCDAGVAQDDAYVLYQFLHPKESRAVRRVESLYSEYVHLVCNTKSQVTSLAQVEQGRLRVIVGPEGSGTQNSWGLFGMLNKRLTYVPTSDLSFDEAVPFIVEGKGAQCALFIAGEGSRSIAEAQRDHGEALSLVEVRDPELVHPIGKDKRPVYTAVELDATSYPGLLAGPWRTLSVDAVFFLSEPWAEAHGELVDTLTGAMASVAATMEERAQPDGSGHEGGQSPASEAPTP